MTGFERSQDVVERFLDGQLTQTAAVNALIELMHADETAGLPADAVRIRKPAFTLSTADHGRLDSLMAAVDRRLSSGDDPRARADRGSQATRGFASAGAIPHPDVILRRFEEPDEVRELTLGRFEIVRLGGMTVGRATYQPGWRWSEHVGRALGQERCEVEHLGLVLAGVATAAFADGRVTELRAGELFYIPPEPHDSWVVGDEPYVSLHFMGAEKYAR